MIFIKEEFSVKKRDGTGKTKTRDTKTKSNGSAQTIQVK